MKRKSTAKQPIVAVYAEHLHDARAIRELIKGIRPEVARQNTLRVLKSPPTLVKDLRAAKRRTRASKVVATLRALNVKDGLVAVVFHEDADRVEPAHVDVEATIREAYKNVPCEIVAAVPAWELETWWFLFPDAVAAVCAHWQPPRKYAGRDVGRIRESKEELSRCVKPPGRRPTRFREYREEDCEAIARNVVSMGLLPRPNATSASWERFVAQVQDMSKQVRKV